MAAMKQVVMSLSQPSLQLSQQQQKSASSKLLSTVSKCQQQQQQCASSAAAAKLATVTFEPAERDDETVVYKPEPTQFVSSLSLCYLLGYWHQTADEGLGDPPPKRWIHDPLVVRDRDGRPQEDPLAVHCFCVCSGSALLGDLLGVWG